MTGSPPAVVPARPAAGTGRGAGAALLASGRRGDARARLLLLLAAVSFGAAVGTASNTIACLLLCAVCVVAGMLAGTGRTSVILVLAPLGQVLGAPWPAAAIAAAGIAVGLQGREPLLRPVRPRHRPRRDAWWAVAAVAFLALPAWLLAEVRFSADPLVFPRPAPSLLVLCVAVFGVAVLNSVGEELLWRQCLFSEAVRHGVSVSTALVATSLSFGVAHFQGIPAGPGGIVLAALFGCVLGLVRLRRGLLTAIIVHVLVDVALFAGAARHALFLG